MSDLYREILVQKKTSAGTKFLKGFLIALTALAIVAGLMLWPLLLVGIALAVVCFFVLPKLEVEYEYLYVNGELDIDAIYSKQKRKRMASYSVEELEILAPINSHALDTYQNNQGIKVKDYTSGDPQVKGYALVINGDKTRELVKVEIDDVIVNDIRRMAPRKVNLY